MIYSDVTITVKGNTATLDNDLYLYKNDKNITINISIVNSIWNFAKKLENNIIEKTEATIFTLRWMKGDKVKKVFEDQQIKKGKCEFVITEELIDEDIEMGDYDFQISLLDEEKNSILSIPPVIGQIHINKHIFEDEEVITDTNEVNVATVGLAKTTTGEAVSVVDDEGNYIKTEWLDGDVITKEKLNKIEEGIYNNSSQCKDIANEKLDKNTTDISIYQINKNLGKFDQTYMTDEFLQQIAGNASINAIVGDNTISKDKLMNDCVDYNNLTFIKKSIMNLFNKNSISNQGYILEKNKLVENTNGCISDYIPVKGNTIYTYSSSWSGSWFDSGKTYISDKPYGESTFTSPANAKFYRQNINMLNIDTVMLVEGNVLPQNYVGFGEYSIEFTTKFSEKIKDTINNNITPNKTTFLKIEDDNNLFDKTKTTDNYIIETNGAPVASDVGCISDFIPVESGKTYYFTNNWNGAWYDANKEYISLKEYGTTNAVAPSRAKFLRMSLNMNLKDTYMIMSRTLPTSYVSYSLEGSINFSTEKYAKNISEQLKRVDNKLKGKKWCVIGDSTSDSSSEGVRKYHSYIADETGIIVIDKAKAGTGFIKTYNASENICDRIDTLTGNEGYDYITILAGINDSGSFSIGQCGDTTKDTVCGAIHYCCEQLTKKFPFAKIALITPTNTTYRYDYDNNIRKIADEMIKIGKRFSIKVYDLNGESGLFVWNKTFTDKYFHDQTHPNSLAHQELIAPKILKFLENL